jgi:6-pyruvoyltetrahydropterin/6-carboxytetrahydropterin synthase
MRPLVRQTRGFRRFGPISHFTAEHATVRGVSKPAYRIHVNRDRYKFSCAHMTVFPDGSKERLHGHNYYVSLTIELDSIKFESMIDFGPLKEALAQLCADWKERTLLATKNPYFEITSDTEEEIEFLLCKQRYVLPRGDVLLLPIDNLAVEPLSDLACDRLLETMEEHLKPGIVRAIEVTIEENPGQGATTRREL